MPATEAFMAAMEETTVAVAGETGPEPEAVDQPDATDRRSFEEFFEGEHRGLYGALRLLTRDGHEAEELMQDAFLKLLERWDRVSGLDDPSGYLYRTALNLFRSRRRRLRMAMSRSLRPAAARDELAEVEGREVAVTALAHLTPRQRAAVVLVDVLGLTSEEAARAMRVKASTVRVLAGRGRAALRAALKEGISRKGMGEGDG
jgi:RNA polymerase sigma-70 factor (ECF subfamily)